MSRALLVFTVEINDGEVTGIAATTRDPHVAEHPAAGGAPLHLLRYPKVHAIRAAVAQLIIAARLDTKACATP